MKIRLNNLFLNNFLMIRDKMKNILKFAILTIFLYSFHSLLFTQNKNTNPFSKASFIPSQKYYSVGNWLEDTLGNQRVLINVKNKSSVVYICIPWRRSDQNPSKKGIMITYAKTNEEVKNVYVKEINNEFGEIFFEPTYGNGVYYVYWLPYKRDGLIYWGNIKYLENNNDYNNEWYKKNIAPFVKKEALLYKYPEAEIVEFQSRTLHDSFFPMEVIATKNEVNKLIKKYGKNDFLVFPENREYPIIMRDFLPYRWINRKEVNEFKAEAYKNEYYSFQIGIFAFKEKLSNVKLIFSDLVGEKKSVISNSHFESINYFGKDWEGKSIQKTVNVDSGKVKPLWVSIDIPKNALPDIYKGTIIIKPENKNPQKIFLTLIIKDSLLEDRGDSNPSKHSRLRWLNSQIALDDDIVKPFTPLRRNENTISCLGRSVTINNDGFIKSIKSFFSSSVTKIIDQYREILNQPISFDMYYNDKLLNWEIKDFVYKKNNDGIVEWIFTKNSGPLELNCTAKMEFDGRVDYKIELNSKDNINLTNIILKIPLSKEIAKYSMGMGLKGGLRPVKHSWKWNVDNHQDKIWIGEVNAGLQLQLRGDNYERPLVNLHYHHKKIKLPDSWYNDGKGGCEFYESDSSLVLSAYTGECQVNSNKKLTFIFSLLITPFKTINTEGQWKYRYYHSHPGNPVINPDSIVKLGANVINIHHATYMNPFINYPFLEVDKMKKYVEMVHKNNALMKIYYTVREMSNHICEMGAFRSLDDEIFAYGPGQGDAWLREHLYDNYIPAWYDISVRDAAIITSGMSRLHNYYLEGLDWLTKNVKIDGLYLDDVAYDRTVMKRARKILDRNRPEALIDLHSWNHYNKLAGFANNANLYMESFPYIDRLWFGEVFDYENTTPDYWLIEISGIPYGLMSEMLGDKDGGNIYRGMVYGITNRLPWSGDPRSLWKFWDDYGIQGSEMIGYWDKNNPVKTNYDDILATTYLNKGKAIIAIASWNKSTQDVKLNIDWSKIGIKPENAEIISPEIKDFQDMNKYSLGDSIKIPPSKGVILVIREKNK